MTATPTARLSDERATQTMCARRGSLWLCEAELDAHLAAIIRLENVGVLVGAGASKALGGMTMAELWENFENKYSEDREWLETERFISADDDINVEELIDTLEIAWREWKRFGRKRMDPLKELTTVRANVMRSIIRAALLQQAWWERPSTVETDGSKLVSHRRLLQKLTAARQPGQPNPWVFTTNYDLAIEWAAETAELKVTNGFDGLHHRVFAPHNFDLSYRNMLARGEARFGAYGIHLAKLHGSLNWEKSSNGTAIERSSAYIWPRIREFVEGKDHNIPECIVYPSASKYLHTVGFIFGELFRRFTEFLARPQSALIISGYSFSDDHLNRIIASALLNPTLQLVLCVPEAQRNGDDLELTVCNNWIQHLAEIESPQVTIIGGGSGAHFDALVSHLPDPAIYDEQAERIREALRKHRDWKKETKTTSETGGVS